MAHNLDYFGVGFGMSAQPPDAQSQRSRSRSPRPAPVEAARPRVPVSVNAARVANQKAAAALRHGPATELPPILKLNDTVTKTLNTPLTPDYSQPHLQLKVSAITDCFAAAKSSQALSTFGSGHSRKKAFIDFNWMKGPLLPKAGYEEFKDRNVALHIRLDR